MTRARLARILRQEVEGASCPRARRVPVSETTTGPSVAADVTAACLCSAAASLAARLRELDAADDEFDARAPVAHDWDAPFFA